MQSINENFKSNSSHKNQDLVLLHTTPTHLNVFVADHACGEWLHFKTHYSFYLSVVSTTHSFILWARFTPTSTWTRSARPPSYC